MIKVNDSQLNSCPNIERNWSYWRVSTKLLGLIINLEKANLEETSCKHLLGIERWPPSPKEFC